MWSGVGVREKLRLDALQALLSKAHEQREALVPVTINESGVARAREVLETGQAKLLCLACPCGGQLVNPTPGVVLNTNPAQIHTLCPYCGLRGQIYI